MKSITVIINIMLVQPSLGCTNATHVSDVALRDVERHAYHLTHLTALIPSFQYADMLLPCHLSTAATLQPCQHLPKASW